MTFDEFINKHLGKAKDYDGVSGVQCVDLAKLYLDEVFGIKAGSWGNAKYYWINFPQNNAMKNAFKKISNSASFVPKKGDICIWKGSVNGGYGHIAIATGEGDVHTFYSYDQNWGGKAMRKVKHTYKSFYGVLRPKDQSKIVIPMKKYTDWKNGSTEESVYKLSNLTEKIGTINPYEKGWCYGKVNGHYIVCYVIKGDYYKVGFTKFAGNIKYVPNYSVKIKNGNHSVTVYSDTAKRTAIGSINKNETVQCLDYTQGMSLILYKTKSGYKVGYIKN